VLFGFAAYLLCINLAQVMKIYISMIIQIINLLWTFELL